MLESTMIMHERDDASSKMSEFPCRCSAAKDVHKLMAHALDFESHICKIGVPYDYCRNERFTTGFEQ
jgi:hypothetical protein